jgi:polyhydroxyalkanoate synthesis regulator phasin
MLLFMFAVIVVLLNILIAQLSDTYQNVQADAQRELEINRAWIVARIEHNSILFANLRKKYYQQVEIVDDPQAVLEKWEIPPMNTVRKTLAKMDEKVSSHEQSLKAIKSQMEAQTSLLQKLVEQVQQIQDETRQRVTASVGCTPDSSATAKERVKEIEDLLEGYEIDV